MNNINPKLLLVLFLFFFHGGARANDNQINGFRLGMSRQVVVQELKNAGLTFSSSKRPRDGLEVLETSNNSVRFWIDSDKIVGVFGDKASFKGKTLNVGISEDEIKSILGEPVKAEEIETKQDILGARHFFYQDGNTTLFAILDEGLPRGKSGWIVVSLYLFEDKWL